MQRVKLSHQGSWFFRLKVLLTSGLIAIAWVSPSIAVELQLGDSFETMVAILGKPSGEVDFGDRQIYFYQYGEVVIQNDQVTELKMLSADEYERQAQRREQNRQQLLAREAENKQLRQERAEQLRQQKQTDYAFQSQPALQQLTFWRYLQQNYPEVDFSAEMEQTWERAREEERLRVQEQRFRQLEARTIAAEQRAAQAESAARRAEIEAQRRTIIQPMYPYYPRRHPVGGTSISIENGNILFRSHLRSISDIYQPGFQPPVSRPRIIRQDP